MKYRLDVIGCDATTTIVLELTETEYAFLQRVANLVTKTSTYTCEPIMQLEEAAPNEKETEL